MLYKVNPGIGFATLPFGLGRVRGGQEISTDKDLSALIPHVLQIVRAPQATPFGVVLPDPADPKAIPSPAKDLQPDPASEGAVPVVAVEPPPPSLPPAPIVVPEPDIAPAGPSTAVGFDAEIAVVDMLDPTRQGGDIDVETALQAVRQGQNLPGETIDDILGPEGEEDALPVRSALSKPLPSSQPKPSKRGGKK